jgi:metallo-beta-lactamase family protein
MDRDVQSVNSIEDSKSLNERTDPKILISARGMMTGGRILHHLKAFAGDPKNLILITGFQAEGTRGRSIADGAAEIKIHGVYYPVRAQVIQLENFSAHADAPEIIEWLKSSPGLSPKQVFVTHGEPAASDELRRRLGETFGWTCVVPEPFTSFESPAL